VRVVFANHGGEQPSQFEQAIATIPEICLATMWRAKPITSCKWWRATGSVRRIRLDGPAAPAGVAEIQSSLSMREIKSSNRLPLLLA
jgi:hypothetical protein